MWRGVSATLGIVLGDWVIYPPIELFFFEQVYQFEKVYK